MSMESAIDRASESRTSSYAGNHHGQITTPFYPSLQQHGDYNNQNHKVARSHLPCLPPTNMPPFTFGTATAPPQGTHYTAAYPLAQNQVTQQSEMATLARQPNVQPQFYPQSQQNIFTWSSYSITPAQAPYPEMRHGFHNGQLAVHAPDGQFRHAPIGPPLPLYDNRDVSRQASRPTETASRIVAEAEFERLYGSCPPIKRKIIVAGLQQDAEKAYSRLESELAGWTEEVAAMRRR
jgi:hypothetical protein